MPLLAARDAEADDKRAAARRDRLRAAGLSRDQLVGLEPLDEDSQRVLAQIDEAQQEPIIRPRRDFAAPPAPAPEPFDLHKARFRRQPWDGVTPLVNQYGVDEAFLHEFPALAKTNHYIVQKHAATSKYYDLRLQCGCAHPLSQNSLCEICAMHHFPRSFQDQRCPGTLSFAIPRGFDGMVRGTHRFAAETELHAIRYAEHEGSSVGSTLLYDVGTYTVVGSRTSFKAGYDRGADTTDEEEEDRDPGAKHERKLGECYRDKSRGSKTSFSIVLSGERYKIRLGFSNGNGDYKRPKSRLSLQTVLRKQWLIVLASKPNGEIEFEDYYAGTPMDGRSLLTGRTMEEVKASKPIVGGPYDGEESGFDGEAPDALNAIDAERFLQAARSGTPRG